MGEEINLTQRPTIYLIEDKQMQLISDELIETLEEVARTMDVSDEYFIKLGI